jgi:ABC-2 type transport system ATP-binding protein/lipopolysaccharide transport system ATP-binding protein
MSEPQPKASIPVHVDALSIRYRLPSERVSGMKEFAIRWIQRRLQYRDLWALREVSFQVQAGEVFGIIGRNGAGKSTLLKALAGLLHPSQGRVVVRGRVSPLLDLSAGFHPELTGRENVALFGTLLGMRKTEIDERFEDIISFAELWDFVDAPLRTYSAGMMVRLGFSVATCRVADVFLIDEVLAVGDVHFQAKCHARLQEYRQQGATICLVSHALGVARKLCDRAIWLEGGQVRASGPGAEVIDRYTAS